MSTSTPTRHSVPPANRWAVLALLGVAQLMVVLDATIVNIALPSAQRALHFSTDNRQWVITAYALAFGSLLLLGGKLGDLFGRKWTLIGGLSGFAVASAIGGLAQSFGMLVAARALQGAFGAILAPSALGLLTVTFAGSPDRPKAFGIFSAIAAGGASVGLLLGGVLTQALSWRWSLYVNLAIAVPTAIVALRLLRNERQPARAPHRLPRRRARLGRPVRPRLRLLQRRDDLVVEIPITIVALAAERRAAGRLHRARAARRASAAAAAHRLGSGPRRRLRDDRAGRLGGVRRLPVPHLLPAAEPRLLAAEDRPGLPADDRDDRPHRDDGADAGPASHRRQAAGR